MDENSQISEEEIEILKERERVRLKYMTFYCTTRDCLRSFMLRYFGERTPNYCGKCSNCISNFETVDITVDAQKIMSCMVRTNQTYGIKMICDILRGSKNSRLLNLSFDKLSTYGLMKDYSENKVRSIINALVLQKYLVLTEDEYPVLKLGKGAAAVLKGKETITTKILKEQQTKPTKRVEDETFDNGLFTHLKTLRKDLAARASVPAYVVFTDASLKDMCRIKPTTIGEFSNVSGVGRAKLDKYGKIFIDAIKEYEEGKGEN